MPEFPTLSPERRLALLEPPQGPVSVVLDTDTYNEIDDQFALVYALLVDTLSVEAVYAAPFHNQRSTGPADGMERSYQEILRILDFMQHPADGLAFRGAERYLPTDKTPVASPAAEDLVRRARAAGPEPLYVLALGAITNVASALLMAPDIVDKVVVVWLGGQPWYWPTAREFNLQQDVAAAQVLFDSGVPLVHVPCKNVAEHLRSTLPEMATYVKGRGRVGDYLYTIFEDYHPDHFAYSKVIWDISTVAYVANPEWIPTELRPAPILRDDVTWAPEDPQRHVIRQAYDVRRDAVFGDLFRRLAARSGA
jgi:purine nucleosidase